MLNVSVNLEKVLSYNNKTVKFKEDLEAIELVCNTEFNGAKSLRDIHILVNNGFLTNWKGDKL